MRSNLPPPNNTEGSDGRLQSSQSSRHEEYIKQEVGSQEETNEASELGMSIELAENPTGIEFLKEESSSIDWVEHFDQSNDSEVHTREDSSSINWAERLDQSNDSVLKFNR